MTAAISSSFTPPVAPQANATPAPTAPPQQGQNDFARMLSQRQAQAAAPEATPEVAKKSEPAASSKDTQAEAQPAPAQTPHDNTAPRAEKPRATTTAKSSTAKSTKETEAANKAKRDDDGKTDKADAIDPALADWLSALHLPQATPATPAVAADAAAANGQATTDTAPAKSGKTARTTSALGGDDAVKGSRLARPGDAQTNAALRGAKEGAADSAAAQAKGASETPAAAAWQAVAEQAALPVQAGEHKASSAVDALGALNGANGMNGTAAPRGTSEAAAPTTVNVPTPATSPEFPKALGVQVSVLARDGIQQAEIHLHPADMGPISVQIAVEGTKAQVDFGADLAATRQIIEGSLPELATALRDAGFTLSGGSVNSQASGQHNGSGSSSGGRGDSNGSGSKGDTAIEAAAPRRTTVHMANGGVDIYA